MDKVKKPFYKKWWFWVIVVVIGIGALGGDDNDTKDNKEPTTVASEDEKTSEDVEEEVKEEPKEEEKEEKENEDVDNSEKASNEVESKDTNKELYDLLETGKMKVNIKTASNYFIEEYEKQRIKKLKINNTAVYSTDVVRDKAGTEFPYSFLITGRYEEKGTGQLKDFAMTVAYRSKADLDNGQASCIQYLNDDTNTYINVMNEDDDILLQINETLK